MFELTVQTSFSAAHSLREYQGKCEHLHGHNYRIEITLAAPELNRTGMVMDFKEVKAALEDVLGRLDHTFLNEVEPFAEVNPTAENIARHVAEGLAARLPEGVAVARTTCWESDGCAASYVPEA